MNLSEIFLSLQGESCFAGLPCIFIRAAGCNLRCVWCDTKYAYETKFKMGIDEILSEVKKFDKIKLVEITGGEPLLQEETFNLIDLLHDNGYKILVETTLAAPLEKVRQEAIKIVDIKCPDSAMSEYNDFTKIDFLQSSDEIKFVIASRADFDWACSVLEKYPQLMKSEILFSPVSNAISPNTLANWILDKRIQVRLQLQMHKIINLK